FSPSPLVDEVLHTRVMDEIITPTVTAMAAEGTPFKGVLYAGLILTDTGPKLLEYNTRFGDPECQTLMVRLRSDLLPALIAARDGQLAQTTLRWHPDPAACVVMATKGYPGSYEKGSEIKGLTQAASAPGVTIFHAGTKHSEAGTTLANGGRVLGITATGEDLNAATQSAYDALDRIEWLDGFFRRDIAKRYL
ncbi:MAG: phosphoribosylglycinamide synthetase C domain-containing protein, partial [Pseudomonadota bacterium]